MFNSKAQKALRKAWESRVGAEAGVKRVVSENFKTVNRPERVVIRENREAARALFQPYKKRKGTIKDVYKRMNVNEKINLRDELVNKKVTSRVSQSQRDHGLNIESPGRLSSGRDMGYGNREWNVFRASSGHGYKDTW